MKTASAKWESYTFDQLTAGHLYRILKLRQDIFIIEQNSSYKDIDDLDPLSSHLLGFVNGEISAYLRIVPPDIKYKEASLGRILVIRRCRGRGLGKELVSHGISSAKKIHETNSIRIEAQFHLLAFYERLGFTAVSNPYNMDGILHSEMLLI